MTNELPKTNREILIHMKDNGANLNQIRWAAHQMSEDIDDKYDQSFGRVEISVKKENEKIKDS